MKESLKLTLYVVLAVVALSSTSGYASKHHRKKSGYAGQTCRRTDTDPLKCLVCVQAWEANNSKYRDMQRVVGVVKTRFHSGRYPKNICKIVYQPGQFVGLRSGKVLPNNPGVIAMMVRAARGTGANGYLGFRTGANGENKLRKTAVLRDEKPVSLPQYASLKRYTPIAAEPETVDTNYTQTAYAEDDAPAAAAN